MCLLASLQSSSDINTSRVRSEHIVVALTAELANGADRPIYRSITAPLPRRESFTWFWSVCLSIQSVECVRACFFAGPAIGPLWNPTDYEHPELARARRRELADII